MTTGPLSPRARLAPFRPPELSFVVAAGSLSTDRVIDAVVDIFAAGLAARPESLPTTDRTGLFESPIRRAPTAKQTT